MIYTCVHCQKKLDTEVDEYVKTTNRYAHKKCREKFLEKQSSKVKKEAAPKKKTANIKKCYYCGEDVDISTEEYAKPRTNRYAHKKCYDENYNADDEYIATIYQYLKDIGMKYDYTQCERQRKNFIQKMGYTNEGIYLTLKFFYGVEKADLSKSENRIGIVPYKYDEAQRYFNSLERKQKQIGEAVKKQLEKEHKVIVIEAPYQKKSRRKYIDLDMIGGE